MTQFSTERMRQYQRERRARISGKPVRTDSGCLNCIILEARIKDLEELLDSLPVTEEKIY